MLEWTEPTTNGASITQYTLYKDAGSGTYYPIYQGINTYFNDSSLDPGSTYNYKVSSTNSAGESALSGITSISTGTVPGLVENMAITLQS